MKPEVLFQGKSSVIRNKFKLICCINNLNINFLFISYDEPLRRALFTVSIRHDSSLDAISNTPIASRTPVTGTNNVITTFEQTFSTHTSTLAFIVSDLVFVEDASSSPIHRIYGRQSAIANGDGSLALDASVRILAKYEEYLGVPYPLAKIDQFASPEYGGVVENWGVPVYVENFLLFDEVLDRTQDRENIITLVSHIIGVSVNSIN